MTVTAAVLYHCTYRHYHADYLSPVGYALAQASKQAYLRVELFFLLSGYIILHSAQGKTPSQFSEQRMLRLYPPYRVACIRCLG